MRVNILLTLLTISFTVLTSLSTYSRFLGWFSCKKEGRQLWCPSCRIAGNPTHTAITPGECPSPGFSSLQE